MVHQEAERTEIHSESRQPDGRASSMVCTSMEHVAVAAQCHQRLRVVDVGETDSGWRSSVSAASRDVGVRRQQADAEAP